MLEVLKGDYGGFFKQEQELVPTKSRWQPGILLRMAMNQMYIEPQDQRKMSRYPECLGAMLLRAAKNLSRWEFHKYDDFYPNPELTDCFFFQTILSDILQEIERRREIAPAWDLRKKMMDNPLTDDFLRNMFENGLSVQYQETTFGRANVTEAHEWGRTNLLIRIGRRDVPPEERDSVLVHEVGEAYLKILFGNHRPEHNFVNELEDQLHEFGFAQTIKRMIKEYEAVRSL